MDITRFKFKHFPNKDKWKGDAKMATACRQINEVHLTDGTSKSPSELQLNTITLVAKLDVSYNLAVIVAHLERVDPESITCPTKRKSKTVTKMVKSGVSKTAKKMTDFYNSLTWKFMIVDGDVAMNLAVKVFPNGKLHFSGLRSIKACAAAPYVVARYLEGIEGAWSGAEDVKRPSVLTTDICMIHTNFHLFDNSTDHVIKQRALTNLLMAKYKIGQDSTALVRSAEFNPSRHAGINIKWLSVVNQKDMSVDKAGKPKGQISIFVFESGATIITGGKEISECKQVCSWLIDVINAHPEVVAVAQMWQKKKRKVKKVVVVPDVFKGVYNGAYGMRGKLKDE